MKGVQMPDGPHAFIHRVGSGYTVNSPAHDNGEGSESRILNTADVRALVTLPEGAASVMVTPVDLVTAQGNSDPVIIIDPPAA